MLFWESTHTFIKCVSFAETFYFGCCCCCRHRWWCWQLKVDWKTKIYKSQLQISKRTTSTNNPARRDLQMCVFFHSYSDAFQSPKHVCKINIQTTRKTRSFCPCHTCKHTVEFAFCKLSNLYLHWSWFWLSAVWTTHFPCFCLFHLKFNYTTNSQIPMLIIPMRINNNKISILFAFASASSSLCFYCDCLRFVFEIVDILILWFMTPHSVVIFIRTKLKGNSKVIFIYIHAEHAQFELRMWE